MKQLRAAIYGASGYAGGELLRILSRHPLVKIEKVFAQSAVGSLVSDVHPWQAEEDLTFEALAEMGAGGGAHHADDALHADIVFLALPHGEAMALAPQLLEQGKMVIDLSGDHRAMDAAVFEKYYGRKQAASEILEHAVYGLPEWSFETIRTARFIANPGCYATSAILALAPLLVDGLIDSTSIVISSMSGVSGAGRKAAVEYSFAEVNENVKAYKVGDHQHTPEIEGVLGTISSQVVGVTFIPHLIPITRGIYSTIVANVAPSATEEDVFRSFEKHYADKPFVRFSRTRMPEIRRVANSNFIDITARFLPERGQVIVISTLDNLVKGAAGQAVQNMNIMCGFSEKEGLIW